MDAIETFNVDDKVVEIYQDEDPSNPRDSEYQDNCDMFICFHRRYNLGDKHNYRFEDYSGWDEMEDQIIKDLDPIEIRRLYLYDHSGLTIADHPFDCPWDSGQIGFALITKKSAREEYKVKRISPKIKKWAKEYLDATIKEYDNYLTGSVYGYIIKDQDDNQLDSCWGFNGEIEYVKEEATNTAKDITIPPKPEPVNPDQLQLNLT